MIVLMMMIIIIIIIIMTMMILMMMMSMTLIIRIIGLILMITIIPIVVTLVGIVTDVSSPQLLKAQLWREVYVSGMTTSPTGHSNQAAYVVTDDGIIDNGNDVPKNASPPNDKNVSLLLLMNG